MKFNLYLERKEKHFNWGRILKGYMKLIKQSLIGK